jgi:DNA-binding MarR family transcriptional regulator
MADDGAAAGEVWFALFNEIGILAQLSGAMLEARLPRGFVVGQFAVLNHLVRVKDGRTPLDLARAFQVPKTTMTHSLAMLERHALIRSAPNAKDGRSKCVFITPQGRAFRETAIHALLGDMRRLEAEMPQAQLADIVPRLAALRAVMDRMRD